MQLHEHLKALKIKASLSNTEIAQESGVSISNISRIFSGENDNPSILTLVPILKALHGSLDLIYGLRAGEDENLASLVGSLKQRLLDKQALIDHQDKIMEDRVAEYERRLAEHKDTIATRRSIFNEQIVAYEKHISDLKEQLAREKDHNQDLKQQVADAQKEVSRIHKADLALSICVAIMAVIVIFALYLVVDSFNGGWGLIRY